MTDTYPWNELAEYRPVDSGGCLWGEIDRPARAAVSQDELFILTDPSQENAYVESEHIVDLEANR